ncbi:MAG TPA: ABC transporter permease, partial [Gemmataceae bacterium]|nr:ABC transporter permease [Gemmataceae bacterium]
MRSAVFVLAASVLGAASPAPADDANTRKPAKITARSVKPAQLAPGEDRVMRYGLTFRDLDALATLLDGTKARVVPVRHVTRDVTCLDRTARSRLVATVSEFASVEGVEVTKGRFLTEDDNRESQNVVVLGPTIAAALFPSADPIGQTIGCGGHFFKVVGVTRAQKPGA